MKFKNAETFQIKNRMAFNLASQKVKYLVINLIKYVKDLY